jgi:hypothetical protein
VEQELMELQRAADALNEASDRLNEAIERQQAAINATKIGLSAWRKTTLVVEGKPWRIGYGRIGHQMGLIAKQVTDDADDEPMWLTAAPRVVRVMAISVLGDVVKALTDKADKMLEAMPTGGHRPVHD